MESQFNYLYEVATRYEDTTRYFHTYSQAKDYFDTLDEPASLWDLTDDYAELKEEK